MGSFVNGKIWSDVQNTDPSFQGEESETVLISVRDEKGVPINPSDILPPSTIPEWQLLEDKVNALHGPPPSNKPTSRLINLSKTEDSVQRIQKRLKKGDSSQNLEQDRIEADLKMRDRQAFKW